MQKAHLQLRSEVSVLLILVLTFFILAREQEIGTVSQHTKVKQRSEDGVKRENPRENGRNSDGTVHILLCEPPDPCPHGTLWDYNLCDCVCSSSPIVIDTSGDGFEFTDGNGGVSFDIKGDGAPIQIAWTTANSDDAFLCYDRNGDGRINDGTELFGNRTPQPPSLDPNGFLALSVFDSRQYGGNGDNRIDNRDAIFSSLRLWRDQNHNGISELNEFHTLLSLGINAISLDYKEGKRTDQYGNQFRFRAKVYNTHDTNTGVWAWDVYFVRASR